MSEKGAQDSLLFQHNTHIWKHTLGINFPMESDYQPTKCLHLTRQHRTLNGRAILGPETIEEKNSVKKLPLDPRIQDVVPNKERQGYF